MLFIFGIMQILNYLQHSHLSERRMVLMSTGVLCRRSNRYSGTGRGSPWPASALEDELDSQDCGNHEQ